MEHTWKKIDRWLSENAPGVLADLRPPVTEQALAELQASLEFPTPPELRQWLSIHDGQAPGSIAGTVNGWISLGAEQIATTYRTFNRLLAEGDFDDQVAESDDGLVKPLWWSPRWVPFLESPGGDYLVVDTDPTESGTMGQIVTFCHDYESRRVKAASLAALMEEFLSDLEAERYYYESPRKGLRRH